jgi:hypothetical protein
MRVAVIVGCVSVGLLACNETKTEPTAATSTVSTASTAPIASAPPTASAQPIVDTGGADASPAASTSAASTNVASTTDASTLPSDAHEWLKLAAGESMKERITSGSKKGCYVVKAKHGEEIRCPPMAAPPATLDTVGLTRGFDCPPGFAVSGSDSCSRTCTRDSDCHGKDKCHDGQCY